ncbi:MAG: serine hydrolase domain-containing protein [Myxococcota bacterium]
MLPRAASYLDATMRDLLSHQGGILDVAGDLTTTTSDAFLRDYAFGGFGARAYSMNPPGLFFNYANPNFSFAGLVSERLSEEPWADLVEGRLFEPLAMTRSVARRASVDANHASGNGFADLESAIAPVPLERTWENAFTRPSGLVWSTPSDQMRLARFLIEGDADVLSDELRTAMVTGRGALSPDSDADRYAFGLFVSNRLRMQGDEYELEVWSHGGNTFTHSSLFLVIPSAGFAVSILSNGAFDDFSATARAVIRAFVELPAPTTPSTPTLDADVIASLAGSYDDPNNVGEVRVSVEDGALRLSMPTLDRLAIPYEPQATARSSRVWDAVIQGAPLDLRFIDVDSATYLVNRAFVAVRRNSIRARRATPVRDEVRLPTFRDSEHPVEL